MPLVPHYFVAMLSAFLPLDHVIGLLNSTFYGDVRFLGLRVVFIPNLGINDVVKRNNCAIVRRLTESPVRRGYRQTPHTVTHVIANGCHNLN